MSSTASQKATGSVLNANLRVHAGGTADWSISSEAASYIATLGGPGKTTLETGAGLSTILFAQQGGQHICITPSADEIRRIRDECTRRGVSTERLTLIEAPSERALPAQDWPALDAVLIDGGHDFPLPMIDFYYTAGALKIGGVLLIDDIQIWSCALLRKVLREDPAWDLVTIVGRRTAVFRKVAAFHYQEFCDQPYVLHKTRWPHLATSMLRGLDLIREGQYGLLWARTLKALRRSRTPSEASS